MGRRRYNSQSSKLLRLLQALQSGGYHNVPGEYLRYADGGVWVSTWYLKNVLLISECNGRISELRSEGFNIETSTARDKFGFVYHRLKSSLDSQFQDAVARDEVAHG